MSVPPTLHVAAMTAPLPALPANEPAGYPDLEKAPLPPTLPATSHAVEEPAPAADWSKNIASKAATPKDITPQDKVVSKTSAQRRQLAVVQRPVDRFTILPNLQDPKSYRRRDKAGIVFVVALASFAGPFASNSLQPAFPQLRRAWNIPNTVVALTTTLFLFATGVAPLWYAFLSERYGRRPVYLSGFLIFTLASVLCAVSTNVGFLLSFRFLQAAGASCAQSVGLGIIADIYVPEERGRATGCLNPQVVPRTYRRSAAVATRLGCFNHLDFLLAINNVFRSLEIALAYVPPAFGYIIGSISGGYLSDYAYRRAKARDGDRFVPESRLVTAWCGVPFMPIGLLIFGWTLRTHQNWPVPLAGSFIFGLGFMLGTGTIMTYFADVIPGQSASVVACFNLLRNVAAALSAALLAVKRWGNHWRQEREEHIAAER
ncbi:hypothetical protein FRC07_006647 [Ceratobasidium sp. 392]|nr:hypothetical protein FRC07_006647 [Ceratobasidium sp. 392]